MTNPVRTTYAPDQLSAGGFPIALDVVVIAAGQILHAGAVLGQVDESGEYQLCATAASDGSQAPVAILDQPVNTTNGAAPAAIRLTGEVLASQLILGEGMTLAKAKAALRTFCLFIR